MFNGSRGAISQALDIYQKVKIISVTVPVAVLAKRLVSRGRESVEEIEKRLERAAILPPAGVDLIAVSNAGPIEQSVADFIKAIRAQGEK